MTDTNSVINVRPKHPIRASRCRHLALALTMQLKWRNRWVKRLLMLADRGPAERGTASPCALNRGLARVPMFPGASPWMQRKRRAPAALNCIATAGGDDVQVAFDLTNTGSRDGDEVAPACVRATTASVATPVKELKAFSRAHLRAGETQHLILHLKKSALAIWGANRTWQVEPGEYTVAVGGSSDANLNAKFQLDN